MKDIKEYLTNESRTRLEDIEQYAKSWVNEWGIDFFGNIMSSFLKGMQAAVEEEEKYSQGNDLDKKFTKRCKDYVEKAINDVNKEIY